MGSKTRAGLVGLDNNPTNSERSDLSSLPQLIAKRVSISERSDEDKQETSQARGNKGLMTFDSAIFSLTLSYCEYPIRKNPQSCLASLIIESQGKSHHVYRLDDVDSETKDKEEYSSSCPPPSKLNFLLY